MINGKGGVIRVAKKHKTGKLKYGSVSALMLAMVLIALIVLNAGVYALEKKKGWRIDLSFNGIVSQSRETAEVYGKTRSSEIFFVHDAHHLLPADDLHVYRIIRR